MSNKILPTEIITLYRIWTSMMYRCHKPENKQYKNYGARGIYVCQEWHDFNRFCEDIGARPKDGLHLDRFDNNLGYSKENCRWTTPKINHRNKRNCHYYDTHVGKICQSELIETTGFTRRQFRRFIEKHGESEFLKLFKEGNLPKKREVPSLEDIIGKKFGKLTVVSLDDDKSTGARYFCLCDCGKETRVSRFRLNNNLASYCISCARKGDRNPKRKRSFNA